DHPQAEIARKTGVGKHNVSRYIKGTKIPGEFLVGLVQQLGVNPTWLLAGEGTPYLSDVTTGTAKMAGNLLELVQAMSEVAKLRMGALASKTHFMVLRQLDEALRKYEQLREELNAQSTPFFRSLINDYAEAAAHQNLERAQHLRRAAHQIARLSDDATLLRELNAVDAYFEYQNKNIDKALELQRKVLMGVIGAEDQVRERVLVEAFNYARALAEIGRYQEAYETVGAVLELGRGLAHLSRYQLLWAQRGALEVELGNLHEGMRILGDAVPQLDPREGRTIWGDALVAQMLAGTIDWRGASETEVDGIKGVSRSGNLVRWAFWLQDPEAIQHICARFVGPERWQVLPESFLVNSMHTLVEINEGNAKSFTKWRKEGLTPRLRRARKGVERISLLIEESVLAMAARHRSANEIIEKTDDEIRSLPDGTMPGIIWRAIHLRNVMRCKGSNRKGWKARVAAAESQFKQWTEAGYHVFRVLLSG
ncbi:MAG: helix-turn-helix domain-containing protein, partial [Planctomycetota bacterium]